MAFLQNLAKVFGLNDDEWLNHANPLSVWTRIIILPFLILAIWSRVWIGWYCLIPIILLIIWTLLNPRAFPKPKTTKRWMSKAVLGEKVLANKEQVEIPKHHIPPVTVLIVLQVIGTLLLICGLWRLMIWPTIMGTVIIYFAKLWFLDRMVWLFDEMKTTPEYQKLDF